MSQRGTVALFVTCIVDVMRPRVGFAAARLISALGFDVEVPAQACCGQPSYNSGDRGGARKAAKAMIRAFEGYDHVVAPSGSCAATLVHHYPDLFEPGSAEQRAAQDLSARTQELVQFLSAHGGPDSVDAAFEGTLTVHDACSGLRELGIKAEPRALLSRVKGLQLKEMKDAEACCGFGGAFCVKYPDISGRIVSEKCADIEATGADGFVTGDVGCLLNIEGRLHRQGSRARAFHIAEVLAGMTETDS